MVNENNDKAQLYRKTPLMGWASWNFFRTNISEEILKKQADALIETGLAEKGYCYFNIDDGFFGGRDEEGRLIINEKRFPNGIKVMADYVHSLGMKAGIYSEAGDNTCGYYYDNEIENGAGVGLYGHEEQDLRQYLGEWGFDFIKIDWCGGIRLGLDEKEQYTKIGKIIDQIRKEENKSIVYNVCRWQFPGPWVAEVADSWRTASDIRPNFDSVVHQLDLIKPLRRFCSPGHVNDLDMLQVGNGMTFEEDQAHFAMWCMMSTPLMLGCDLTKISNELLELVSNDELIAVQQDEACLQAYVVKEIYREDVLAAEVWIKDLGKNDSNVKAVAFLNRSLNTVEIDVTMEEIGLSGEVNSLDIRDLIHHKGIEPSGHITLKVPPHSCAVYKVKAEYAVPVKEIAGDFVEYNGRRISLEEALKLIENGALLVDVRDKEAYEKMHFEGAIHVPYSDINDVAKHIFPDKARKIILYCNTGKKSNQAARSMYYMGYHNVEFTAIYS